MREAVYVQTYNDNNAYMTRSDKPLIACNACNSKSHAKTTALTKC